MATVALSAMITAITTMITPDLARLYLAQYLSPAFPIGGFAWSQGLEWAMDQGVVTPATLRQWLADWLDFGCGWTDAVLVALALRPGADHAMLDDLARASCLGAQRLQETVEQGAALTANLAELTGHRSDPAALPVAFGRACAALPLPHPEIIAAFLQAQLFALISAAIRFMPLGPLKGQALLTALQPHLLTCAARAAAAGEDDLFTAAWGTEMAAMHHETMPVRIFRS